MGEETYILCAYCGVRNLETNTCCVGCGRKLYKRRVHSMEVYRSIGLKVALVVAFVVVGAVALSALYLGVLSGERAASVDRSKLALVVGDVRVADHWHRGADDLPETSSVLSFSVSEEHRRVFDGNVTVTVDGAVVYQTMYGGGSRYGFEVSRITSAFDTTHTVMVSVAALGGERVEESFDWNPVFPRSPIVNDLCYSLMITPREETVVAALEDIKESSSWLRSSEPDWMFLKDWVSTHVRYDWSKVRDYDPDLVKPDGAPPYDPSIGSRWDFPFETIGRGLGVCRDYAVLYCSLLRASGWSPDNVYIGLSRRHAYVLMHAVPELPRELGWLILEPQGGGWNLLKISELTDPLIGVYDTRYYFNDCGFHAGVPWRD